MILPSGAAMKPRLASSKSWGSARLSSWAICSLAFWVAIFGVAGGAADAAGVLAAARQGQQGDQQRAAQGLVHGGVSL
jgi:hypothetical protein